MQPRSYFGQPPRMVPNQLQVPQPSLNNQMQLYSPSQSLSRHDPFREIQQIMMGFGMLENDPIMSAMLMSIGDPFNDIFNFSQIHKNVHGRGVQGSFVMQSFVSSAVMGPDGNLITENYFSNNVGEHRAGNTISQKQEAYKSNQGVNRIAQQRMLNDRGRKIVRQKIGSNIQETNHYYNIDEQQAQIFDNDWRAADRNMNFLQNHQRYLQLAPPSSQAPLALGYNPRSSQPQIIQQSPMGLHGPTTLVQPLVSRQQTPMIKQSYQVHPSNLPPNIQVTRAPETQQIQPNIEPQSTIKQLSSGGQMQSQPSSFIKQLQSKYNPSTIAANQTSSLGQTSSLNQQQPTGGIQNIYSQPVINSQPSSFTMQPQQNRTQFIGQEGPIQYSQNYVTGNRQPNYQTYQSPSISTNIRGYPSGVSRPGIPTTYIGATNAYPASTNTFARSQVRRI